MQSLIGVFVPALVGTILKYGKVTDHNIKILVSLGVALVVATALHFAMNEIFDLEAFGMSVMSIYGVSQAVYQVQKSARGIK